MAANIEIKTDGVFATIVVGGVELKDRVKEYKFTHKAGEFPKLEITFDALGVSVLSEHAFVAIPENIRGFFRKYGVIETEKTAQSASTEQGSLSD